VPKKKTEKKTETTDQAFAELAEKFHIPAKDIAEMAACLTTDEAGPILVRVGGAGDEKTPAHERLVDVLDRIAKDPAGRPHRLLTCQTVCGEDFLGSKMHSMIKRMRKDRGEDPWT